MRNTLNINVVRQSNGGFSLTVSSLDSSAKYGENQVDNSSFSTAEEVGSYLATICEDLDKPKITIGVNTKNKDEPLAG